MLLKCENIDVGTEAKKRTAVDAAARNNMADLVWILTALSPMGKPFLSAIEGGIKILIRSFSGQLSKIHNKKFGCAMWLIDGT